VASPSPLASVHCAKTERGNIMSFYNIIPIVISMLFLSILGLAWGFVCSIIYSGLKGRGHNIGPTYGIGFEAHHPGGIILSDEERDGLMGRNFKSEVIISY
jgi:hypothetical protein